MMSEIQAKARDSYTFKHNNKRILLMREHDKGSFILCYAKPLKTSVLEALFFIPALIGSGFLSWWAGNSVYRANLPEKSPYAEGTLLSELEASADYFSEILAAVAGLFVGAISFSVLLALALTVFLTLTKGFEYAIEWFQDENIDLKDGHQLFFAADVQPYLHLLNPETLYRFIEGKNELETKNQEISKLYSHSQKLKKGFLKDEVNEKHKKLIKEVNSLQDEIRTMMNEERNNLKVLSKSERAKKEEREYKAFEERVLKDLSA